MTRVNVVDRAALAVLSKRTSAASRYGRVWRVVNLDAGGLSPKKALALVVELRRRGVEVQSLYAAVLGRFLISSQQKKLDIADAHLEALAALRPKHLFMAGLDLTAATAERVLAGVPSLETFSAGLVINVAELRALSARLLPSAITLLAPANGAEVATLLTPFKSLRVLKCVGLKDAPALLKSPTLEKLDSLTLDACDLKGKWVSSMLTLMDSTLTHLCFNKTFDLYVLTGTTALHRFTLGLSSARVESISFCNHKFDRYGNGHDSMEFVEVVASLALNQTLRKLDLSNTEFRVRHPPSYEPKADPLVTRAFGGEVVRVVRCSRSLRSLDLTGCGLDDEAVESILLTARGTRVHTLRLAGNGGAAAAARVLLLARSCAHLRTFEYTGAGGGSEMVKFEEGGAESVIL